MPTIEEVPAHSGVSEDVDSSPEEFVVRIDAVADIVVFSLASLLVLAGDGCAEFPPDTTSDTSSEASTSDPADGPAVLVFSKTGGFRHASIADGVRMIRELSREHGFAVEHSEDVGLFRDEVLSGYAAVVFLSTTGDILDERQQAAFERYIRGGGAFVGIHAAADTEYEWPWYGRLVGAWFRNHPAVQAATLDVDDATHPSTRMLPERWQRTDEWYNYRRNPRGDVHILMTLDEDSYEGGEHGGEHGGDHPIAWCHRYDGGRSWYTGGGHTEESYAEPLFRQHVLGGIRWAMGTEAGECGG